MPPALTKVQYIMVTISKVVN